MWRRCTIEELERISENTEGMSSEKTGENLSTVRLKVSRKARRLG